MNSSGLYGIWLFHSGEPQLLIIDDFFPLLKGESNYAFTSIISDDHKSSCFEDL